MHELKNVNGEFTIDYGIPFEDEELLTDDDVYECFMFAYDMTFGAVGEHRDHRSGGHTKRRSGEIFIDTFQGKMAEYAFYNYSKDRVEGIGKPDVRRMGLNEWDTCDFKIADKEIAIKSTKFYGHLLLLETKDWDENGCYIPNSGTGNDVYDYFVLIRIKPDGTAMMKENHWFYSDHVSSDEIKMEIAMREWQADIVGYITRDELVNEVIRKKHILPQKAKLNGRTVMDAENYYVQAGDMHDISELLDLIDKDS